MRIIEIEALENGAHRNQEGNLTHVPIGWAIIPDDMEIPQTFPFVNMEVENGVVTKMTEGVVPDPIPTPEPEYEPSTDDVLNALLGVSE